MQMFQLEWAGQLVGREPFAVVRSVVQTTREWRSCPVLTFATRLQLMETRNIDRVLSTVPHPLKPHLTLLNAFKLY
jgi:hypothetical protein